MQVITAIRQQKPLILNLTNAVSMDIMANSLLALGAAPLMSQSEEELAELVAMAAAVVINIGTLDAAFVTRCLSILPVRKPVILDPAGAGATRLRTVAAKQLAPYSDVIKGNASEILALTDQAQRTQGVESTHQTTDAMQAADQLAIQHACVVVVTGETDYVTDGKRTQLIHGGSALMTRVTGMGCSLGGILAACQVLLADPFAAAIAGSRLFKRCAEVAAQSASAPGSFRVQFLDVLYQAEAVCS
jgi:hydroxyethylthiazole kinase